MEPDDSAKLAIERTKVELERTKLAMDLVKHLSFTVGVIYLGIFAIKNLSSA